MDQEVKFSRRDLFRLGRRIPRKPQRLPTPPPPPDPPQETGNTQVATGPGSVDRTFERINAEPAYAQLLLRLLEFCTSTRTGTEIHDWMLPFPEIKAGQDPPEALLHWMIEAGAIASDGTEDFWKITEAGRAVLEYTDPAYRLRQLTEEEPPHLEIYCMILQFCETPRNATEIESLLFRHANLPDPRFFPNHYIDRLAEAGGLIHADKYQISEAGRTAAEAMRKLLFGSDE